MTRAFAFALLLAVASVASAQELEVQVEAGWDGTFVEDAWAPLRVTLTLPAAPSADRTVSTEAAA